MKQSLLAAVCLLGVVPSSHAQTPVMMREAAALTTTYSIRANVELAGRLTMPGEKVNSEPVAMNVSGSSAIEYEERMLAPLTDRPGPRSMRLYRNADFRRTVGAKSQSTRLRQSVRRMVVLRYGTREVPISPDGPLTYGELDLVRTDVFAPALAGLLPARAVLPGDRWQASATAIEELTDMEKIEEGGLECRLDSFGVVNGRRVADVKFSGTVRGVNEDGPNKQQLDGSFTFDLDAGHLSALGLNGIHFLMDAQGKTTGRVEGKFQLTRRLVSTPPELADAAIKNLVLEPNAANSLLVYESNSAGVRFLYPRRWRVTGETGKQIIMDEPKGNGILITVETLAKTPSAAEFLRESHEFLTGQRSRLLKADPPQRLQPAPKEIERFGLDVELNNQPARMEYFIARQADGGATIAARFAPSAVPVLRPEVEEIVRSIVIQASGSPGVVPLPGK